MFVLIGCSDVVGQRGAQGIAGPKGDTGATGSSGSQGPQGIQGEQGNAGTNGVNGADGISCSIAQTSTGADVTCGSNTVSIANGTNGLNGNDGNNGIDGTNGTNGIDGTNGTNGVDGTNGTDGTIVTPIQFCSQYGATVYPSNFPEYGICINGNIYAVYWDQANMNAWFAEIVPGLYMSTATGLMCDFVVAPNCVIN